MELDDTIAAVATPVGEAAIALIRVSGPDAFAIAERIFRSRSELSHGKATVGKVVDRTGQQIDQVVTSAFRAPASYTGEDVIEISCHGGVLVTAEVLRAVITAGARHAEPGEFTRRAFLNGKMDLTQAEAVMDLIQARTLRALKAASDQLAGGIGKAMADVGDEILDTAAHLEAYIDFPDEDVAPDVGDAMLRRVADLRKRIADLLATADEGRILREGVKLAICGRPNAGKSSLLNRLVGSERAIVSPVPGTTRDTIDEVISLHGIPFRLTDTAGIRDTDDQVEREGVLRAHRAITEADIVVRVVDSTDPTGAADPSAAPEELLVWNKIDLPGSSPGSGLNISCATGDGIDQLKDALLAKVRGGSVQIRESASVINSRHQACLARADDALARAEQSMSGGIEPELIAIDLRFALDAVGEVIGRVDTEDILGRIFGTFCIGK